MPCRRFVLSTEHARELLQNTDVLSTPGSMLLDVGAGSGSVTEHLAVLFDQVVATEVAGVLQGVSRVLEGSLGGA